jgi:hypothetical protein
MSPCPPAASRGPTISATPPTLSRRTQLKLFWNSSCARADSRPSHMLSLSPRVTRHPRAALVLWRGFLRPPGDRTRMPRTTPLPELGNASKHKRTCGPDLYWTLHPCLFDYVRDIALLIRETMMNRTAPPTPAPAMLPTMVPTSRLPPDCAYIQSLAGSLQSLFLHTRKTRTVRSLSRNR